MNRAQSKTKVQRPRKTVISVIIPMMNEEENVGEIYLKLREVFKSMRGYDYEFVYVDDGSSDASVMNVQALENSDKKVRLLRLARNFGKEIATTAGLHASSGAAAIMIDADLQHPPTLIPEFIKKWREGYDVVVGMQKPSASYATFTKRMTASWYYKLMNAISQVEVTPHATDFRLLDRSVIDEFNRFTERNRMTRGLIDWLGFNRTYIEFTPAERTHGVAAYSYRSLMRLATNSIVSLSFFPLRIAGYLGVIITLVSFPLAIFIFINRYFMGNSMQYTGPAILAVMLLFLVGIILICLGLIALYIANIYGEVVNRPLYVEKRRMHRP